MAEGGRRTLPLIDQGESPNLGGEHRGASCRHGECRHQEHSAPVPAPVWARDHGLERAAGTPDDANRRARTESKLLIRLPFSSVPLRLPRSVRPVQIVHYAARMRAGRHSAAIRPSIRLEHVSWIRAKNAAGGLRAEGREATDGDRAHRSRRRSGETQTVRHSAQCHCSCRALCQYEWGDAHRPGPVAGGASGSRDGFPASDRSAEEMRPVRIWWFERPGHTRSLRNLTNSLRFAAGL